MIFKKDISASEANYSVDILKNSIISGRGGQSSYNIPNDFFEEATQKCILIQDENFQYSRKEKDGNAYVLSSNYRFELGENILWLIGNEYKNKENKFIASIGYQNKKFQLFRTVYDKLNKENYGWFVALYDKNLAGNELIIDVNEEEKILKLDIKFKNLFNNIEAINEKIKKEGNLISLTENKLYEFNRLIYGAPGTGKSNLLEKERKEFGENYERVTFYEDYSYSQFFGTYKPYTDENNKITYKFVAGPFLRQLAKALSPKYNGQPQLLIIEEINRANAASVFGDMFQLLDRNSDGTGEYEVYISEEVKTYLKDEYEIETNTLRLPSNFYLWATMNCADQGVFPLDSAFKRRFDEYKLMDINENENDIKDIDVTIKCNKIGTIKWNLFRRALNEYLLEKGIKDDKLIGPFFIKPSIFKDENKVENAIKDKLLMYLLEDVVRRGKGLFHDKCKSLTSINLLYGKIDNNEYNSEVFSEEFIEHLNQYRSSYGDSNENS